MAEGEARPECGKVDSDSGSNSTVIPSPPPPPVPSADPRLLQTLSPDNHVSSPTLPAEIDDIFKVPPQAALKLLSACIEALVSMTGDVPPTPPPRSPTIPHLRGMEAEKKSIVRSNSERSLTRLAQQRSAANSPKPPGTPARSIQSNFESTLQSPPNSAERTQPVDGVHLRGPPPPPQPPSRPLTPHIIVGDNSQPLNVQHSAITRRFYCRVPPPISITEYLLRIHQYCPMSTGVYLATSLYMYRLAVLERAVAVTQRNAHRLLLAGLRVAMKALDDLSYPHVRFARVGGVSEKELARLEISFCFLTGFDLAVNASILSQQWELLRRGTECWNVLDDALHHVPLQSPPSVKSDVKAQA
ncbi:cyclin-domain-containing protein [Chaetomium strumarium]|uniref:Cyclin-domain-containing protein n=1 Tax=Chaetomium strumarium TaxID=1170767 RepID=A0AAJ0GMJ2_9PEZI|nr:cyclin-domain-containing protein [Chaetomium strumarium]